MGKTDAEAILAERILGFAQDPLSFVMYTFPWGQEGTILEDETGPRPWQRKVLEDMRFAYIEGRIPRMPYQHAVSSGHGVGKSCLTAWLILWAMSTMRDTKCVVTATTETQLRTKTWSELSKWHNLSINSHWFRYTATKLCFAEPEAEETWKADAVTWSETNTIAFQGLHNLGRRILVLFDEASGIHDAVWDATEGALTDEGTEIFWFAFGNPNFNTGRFDACWKMYRNFWRTVRIDSRNVEGSNKEQRKLYGEDHDFFRVRVKGLPPKGEGGNLISLAVVEKAMARNLPESAYDYAPVIIGVDPAWTGLDNLEIVARQGMKAWVLRTIPKNDDDLMIANIVAEYQDDLDAQAVFVDGGGGTGIWSAGYHGQSRRDWHIIWFSGESDDEECINKRAEMWKKMRDWLKDGADIPQDEDFKQDLVSVDRKPRDDWKIQLESKEEMKKKLKASPNKADALALTFAMPVLSGDAARVLDDLEYESEWETHGW